MAAWVEGAAVVVTGAAGGVGQAVATWLAERGAQVFSLDRRRPESGAGTFVEVDVLSEASIDAAVQQVLRARAGSTAWWRRPDCPRSRRRPRPWISPSGSGPSGST